jgi:hypothetical protein
MWCHVVWYNSADVSVERSTSLFWFEEQVKQETASKHQGGLSSWLQASAFYFNETIHLTTQFV